MKNSRLCLAMLAALFTTAACSSDNNGPVTDPATCTTNITAEDGADFVQLCAVDGGARHVRIENFITPATHASTQVVFGFDAPPASAQAPLEADQFRVLLYGGGVPAPGPLIQASWGSDDQALDGDASFVNTGGTVCFDLHDGSATSAPAFIIWVDGQRGADCENKATLTGATAYGARTYWHGTTGTVDKTFQLYFRQAAGTGATPTVTVENEPVMTSDAIAASTVCTTTWTANADWQQLCAPANGIARHVSIEAASSTANNSYFYAIIGQDPDPTGNPALSSGKLIVTGGRSNGGSSWTWFRFNTGSTTQYSYATGTGSAFYTDAPTSICFDMGSNDEGNARFVFWGTGAGAASCATRTSLTLEAATYDSSTDPDTAGIWDVPYITGKLNFIKVNNTAASMTNVVVSSEPSTL